MRSAVLYFAMLIALRVGGQELQMPLDTGWVFSKTNEKEWRSAKVPGCVQADLIEHGVIPDYRSEQGVESAQWVELEDWTYRTSFGLPDSFTKHEHIELEFKGLDTFAEIYLNGALLGSADNLFRTWRFEIKPFLRSGENELTINFRSTWKEGKARAAGFGLELPHDSDSSGISPFVRKAAYQFGWDFCPRLVTMGISGPVSIIAWSMGRIQGAQVFWDQDTLAVKPRVEGSKVALARCRIRLSLNEQPIAEGPALGSADLRAFIGRHALPHWMPRGMGKQVVARLRLELFEGEQLRSRSEFPVGRARNELVQEADSVGRSFAFQSDGRPFFVKGCNVVPPDMMPTHASDSAWITLVGHMRDAGMNMARIWAGGVYPPESFFDACDTVGILVWQDFMLAGLVPAEGEFLENFLAEAAEQVERISHHPCLALFCGNNELDVAWRNWGWQDRYGLHGADSATVIETNSKLWHEALAGIVNDRCGAGHYLASSPISNWGSAEGLGSGDLHYWGVWHGDSAFSSFDTNVGRFMSEWGFQSYPDSALLARFHGSEGLHLGSELMARLQRSYKGDSPIRNAIGEELGIAASGLSLDGFIRASQAVQSLACDRAIRAHRAAWPRCTGTLLWQLNDCWPGPSWSLIDHQGKRKPAYQTVRTLFGGLE